MGELLERSKLHSFKEFTIFKGIMEWGIEGFKQRYCVLDQIHWRTFYSSMRDLLGDSTNAILKKIGEDFGRELHSAVEDKYGIDAETAFLFVLQYLEKLGWGAFWNVKINTEASEITVELHNPNEAHTDGIPSCYHVTGILRGIAKGVLGDEIIVREIECTAKGDKVCKFVIGSEVVVPDLYDKETMEKFTAILQDLKKTIKSSVELLATVDGVPILSPGLENIDPSLWGTIISFLLAGGLNSSTGVNNGNLKEVIINAEQGTIIASQVTDKTIIAAVVGPDTSPGLAGLALKKAKDKIIEILK
ncbi:MAG: hypothetical protein HWN65_10360 [Candidatus Helarchaeota archaeon]|nr:hypothetical protein [Candidatus Helarchaeota archaeon]